MLNSKHFGKIIRDRREKKKLNIAEVAELCEMSYKGYEEIELGDSDPKLSSVLKIVKVLGIDLGELNCLLKD